METGASDGGSGTPFLVSLSYTGVDMIFGNATGLLNITLPSSGNDGAAAGNATAALLAPAGALSTNGSVLDVLLGGSLSYLLGWALNDSAYGTPAAMGPEAAVDAAALANATSASAAGALNSTVTVTALPPPGRLFAPTSASLELDQFVAEVMYQLSFSMHSALELLLGQGLCLALLVIAVSTQVVLRLWHIYQQQAPR